MVVRSINIDEEAWKQAKIRCVDKNITLSEYVEKLIVEDGEEDEIIMDVIK